MVQTVGQQRAADRVAGELASRGWTNADLSRATHFDDSNEPPVDLGTIGDFLAYKRWPKIKTLAKFERAFGWAPGSLRLLSTHGTEIPTAESVAIGSDNEAGSSLLFRQPDELTNDEWRELIARTRGIVEWEIEQAIRRRRG